MLMFMHFRWCSWMRLRPRQRTQRKPEYVYRALVALAGGFWSVTAPENTTNWFPVGDGGFHLYMRIYTPDMDALDTWTAPAITEITPSNVN